MLNPAKKIQRTSQIISVLAKYGFRDFLSRLPWNGSNKTDVKNSVDTNSVSVYTRVRMVLEELGPAFVKLGQAATTREGLLPEELVVEFQKLEDKVKPVTLDVNRFLNKELGISLSDYFKSIEEEPFASASISQVYKAQLVSGENVVLKVRRPGVDELLKIDMALMKDLAKILSTYSVALEKLNLPLIVESFSNSLTAELSLDKERLNMEKFAENFEGNENIKIAKVFPELCNDFVLCMEFLKGTKITDVKKLQKQNIDLQKLAENGLNLYLEQVLVHGFFHGDPHPGNLMVMPDGKIAFLDFGNMGTLLKSDRKQLEDFVTASVEEDAVWLGNVIEDIAIYSKINDRKRYERALNELFEIMGNVSLGSMNLQEILSKVWGIVGDNQIHFPEYIYQLIRGISLMEGIGRKLDPNLNILDKIRPFTNKIILEHLNPKNILEKSFRKLRATGRDIERLPEDLREIFRQVKKGDLSLNLSVEKIEKLNSNLRRTGDKLTLAIVFLGLCILSALTMSVNLKPVVLGIPLIAFIFLLITLFTGFVLILLVLRPKEK
ncbi:ABC1 kinase family protein [Pseudopedobacter beijingensis]|uniref:ABC1 kinase family protein n=1 Tax=Pseudopedobacter beijingensis TaxID=1207056 RepID=A0ABW4IDC0_9SPHI